MAVKKEEKTISSLHGDATVIQLISTKLHPPHPGAVLIERPHLLNIMERGLTSKVSLVVAPAGFGKTTLLTTWLRQSSLPAAWLSLDEHDNDLALFLHYLVAAVQTAFPAATFDTVSMLQAPQLPPLSHIASAFINDLAKLEQEYLLVLDDYHFIVDEMIHKLLARVIDYLPRSVHLILSSRTEPPLPLPRLRSQQQTTEIRAADLCLSVAETQTFLVQALRTPPAQETVATLYTRTEGWITGLQLATLALRGRADETDFVRSFAGSDRHIVDYLMEIDT